MKPFKALILILLLFGCKAKETSVERTKISDTLITKSFDYVSQPISTQIVIDEICDSLGNVRNFRQVESSGANNAIVSTEGNTLKLDLLTGLSRKKTDTIYRTKEVDVYRDREVVKYKVSAWHWVAHLVAGIVVFLLVRFR